MLRKHAKFFTLTFLRISINLTTSLRRFLNGEQVAVMIRRHIPLNVFQLDFQFIKGQFFDAFEAWTIVSFKSFLYPGIYQPPVLACYERETLTQCGETVLVDGLHISIASCLW
jgi:hypothetical protein